MRVAFFEFIRSVNIGQYLPVDSALHRLDPRVKILGSIALLAALTFAPSAIGLVVGLILIGILILLGRIPFGFILNGIKAPLPFLILLALLQLFFPQHAGNSMPLLQVWILVITPAGLMAASMLVLRFIDLILLLSLSSFCISTSEMIAGLRSLLKPIQGRKGFTDDLVMTIQVALRFLPLLAQTAERIAKAQYSRGAQWGTGKGNLFTRVAQVLPLIIPLFLSSLSRAERMALAMDARAYGCLPERTSLVQLSIDWQDYLAVVLFLMVETLVLFIK
jgi:energy-coupling factor transport system permease protein